jgi:acyl-CoA synthetase (AMP-forming)/AMP-acid ligase II
VALVDATTGTQTNYREMIDGIDAFAVAFAARGIGVGDVVGLLAPNSSMLAIAFYGILRDGATFTTSERAYSTTEERYLQCAAAVCWY